MTPETVTLLQWIGGLTIPAVIGWAYRVERMMTKMSKIPQRVVRVERMALRILMTVDPKGAQDELKQNPPGLDTEEFIVTP